MFILQNILERLVSKTSFVLPPFWLDNILITVKLVFIECNYFHMQMKKRFDRLIQGSFWFTTVDNMYFVTLAKINTKVCELHGNV